VRADRRVDVAAVLLGLRLAIAAVAQGVSVLVGGGTCVTIAEAVGLSSPLAEADRE
jgi:hypothetical protein